MDSPKEQLFSRIIQKATTEAGKNRVLSFFERITDEQAAQLIALDGYTEDVKIPIWDADLGGAAKDANRAHDTEPDRYINSKTLPRDIAADLYIIFCASKSFPDIRKHIDTYWKLAETDGKYWESLRKIFVPSVGGHKIDEISIPMDYFNAHVLWAQRTEGNKTLRIPDVHKSVKETNTYFTIDFEKLPGLKTSRRLTASEEEIYIILANLHSAGNDYVSLREVYKALHNKNPQKDADLAPLDERITKMEPIWITLDNHEEAEVTKYDQFVYKGSLLPIERVDCYKNGKFVDQAIHFFREPPAFSYAKIRGQITTIPQKLFIPPFHRSERGIELHLYLIRIIRSAQNGGIENRITFKKIFEKLGLESASLKSRTKNTIFELFDFYKTGGLITDYKADAKGITFFWK